MAGESILRAEPQIPLAQASEAGKAASDAEHRFRDEICSLSPSQRADLLRMPGTAASAKTGFNCPTENQLQTGSKKSRLNVVLVDTYAFPGDDESDRESTLYDEVLEFHHGRDLPDMMKSLKNKYPDGQFDITTDTHGNHGSKNGYKLVQKNGGAEYVKYGALEEALHGAQIDENSVRIFYGGCNAATGYYNANLSDAAKRYARVTYGSSSMNERVEGDPALDFIRPFENDPRYGLLSEIKTPQVDEINAHTHTVPLEKRDYRVKLSDIAKLRKIDPEAFEARIKEFARSYRQTPGYYRDLRETAVRAQAGQN